MKYAIIKTGGKQYKAEENRYILIEKLDAEVGAAVSFDEVTLVSDNGNIKVGQPTVAGAKVTGKVLAQGKDEKILVFKYKRKKMYRKRYGHRQPFTKVMIESIK